MTPKCLIGHTALKTAIHAVLQATDKVLSDNDLVIILHAACTDLADDRVRLPEDAEEALDLVALLRREVQA